MSRSPTNSWEIIIDLIGPEELWPRKIIRSVYKDGIYGPARKMNNTERYSFIAFCIQNGVSPNLIEQFFLDEGYNKNELYHIKWTLTKIFTSKKAPKAWNVHEGRTTEMELPALFRYESIL